MNDMMPKLGLGLIGCGRIMRLVYMKVLATLPEIRVVAIAEPDAGSREQAARCFPDARSAEDFRHLLDWQDVDAVLITAPTFLHSQISTLAFEAGKHVYLEKPLATDLDEAAGVISAWRSAGTAGMIGFNFRYDTRYQEIRRRISAGEVGHPLAVRTVFMTARKSMPPWKQSRVSGGGALMELASHDIDLVRFTCGEVATVQAELQTLEYEHDLTRIVLHLKDGPCVECLASTCGVDEGRFEIYGDRGKLTVDRLHSASVEWQPAVFDYSGVSALWTGLRAAVNRLPRVAALRGRGPRHSYRAALGEFAKAARTGIACTPDLEDGYRSLAIVAAAELAAIEGRAVSLAEVSGENSTGG